MTRMGMHNRITAERFHTIKGALALHESDDSIMRKYQIRNTTLRYIKQCKNFYEYRLRTERCKMRGRAPKVVLPVCGMELIDYPPQRHSRGGKCQDCPECKDKTYETLWWFFLAGGIMLTAVMGFAIVVIIAVITK